MNKNQLLDLFVEFTDEMTQYDLKKLYYILNNDLNGFKNMNYYQNISFYYDLYFVALNSAINNKDLLEIIIERSYCSEKSPINFNYGIYDFIKDNINHLNFEFVMDRIIKLVKDEIRGDLNKYEMLFSKYPKYAKIILTRTEIINETLKILEGKDEFDHLIARINNEISCFVKKIDNEKLSEKIINLL